MPAHAERRQMPYTPEQMFDMVADVKKYPEFLPWCKAAYIHRQDANIIIADLMIGFRMVHEKFTSLVKLNRPIKINVVYSEGPFQYMNNHWIFERMLDNTTLVSFYVDFEFRSKALQKIMGTLFSEAVKLMVSAFQKRAKLLYGSDSRQSLEQTVENLKNQKRN